MLMEKNNGFLWPGTSQALRSVRRTGQRVFIGTYLLTNATHALRI